MLQAEQIKPRLNEVQNRIRQACTRAGRSIDHITLIAVSKRFPADVISQAIDVGQLDFGENYVAELAEKAAQTYPAVPHWHMIGPIQRRSVNKLPATIKLIHTLDRIALLERFGRVWSGSLPPFLVQVNIGDEPQKAGIEPAALNAFLTTVYERFPDVKISGLMAIPPASDDPETIRPYFAAMRDKALEMAECGLLPEHFELSMGMSNDFEIAIAEGATMVRIGSAIFGPRP